jgi:sugar lactone lactonase YvrE
MNKGYTVFLAAALIVAALLTVAGTGKVGFSGDGGPATQARLNTPAGLAADRLGNLFIADGFNNRVRKVSPDGTISTVAGGGHPADHLGDGGPATAASLNAPFGLAVDAEGTLFVGDIFNSRIRRVSPGGTITTVAGNGKAGYSGDGGPATEASLNGANTMAVDATGNLFFTDFGNQAVRRVSPAGMITTVAGNGKYGDSGDGGPATDARFKTLSGVAVDATGNVFISDWLTERVRRVSPDGIITTVVGGGTPADGLGDGDLATKARLKLPRGLAVDPGGNLFVSDNGHFRVRRVGPDGIIITVAGSGLRGFSGDGGPATEAHLNAPINLAIDRSGDLFIGDSWQQVPDDNNTLGNNRIREVFSVAVPG